MAGKPLKWESAEDHEQQANDAQHAHSQAMLQKAAEVQTTAEAQRAVEATKEVAAQKTVESHNEVRNFGEGDKGLEAPPSSTTRTTGKIGTAMTATRARDDSEANKMKMEETVQLNTSQQSLRIQDDEKHRRLRGR